jgi:hypothetical protein
MSESKLSTLLIAVSLLGACTKDSGSTVKIIGSNSRAYSNHKIRQMTLTATGETCTVTFIRPTGALTAGHCIPDDAVRDFSCALTVDGIKPTTCSKIKLDNSVTYGLESASRDIGFMVFSEEAARRLHGGQSFASLAPSNFYTSTTPTTVEIAGYGEDFIRTRYENGKYVPIKGGGDLTGIGRPGRAGSRSLRSCRFVVTNPSTTFLANHELIEIKPENQQGPTCMPTAGDSGGTLLDTQGNPIGIAIAVEYGPDRVERAVYIAMKSKSLQQALSEFFARLKAALGF